MPRGGKTCLYTHWGGAKALFYISRQVTHSVAGEGGKTMQNFFIWGAMPPFPPAGTCLHYSSDVMA